MNQMRRRRVTENTYHKGTKTQRRRAPRGQRRGEASLRASPVLAELRWTGRGRSSQSLAVAPTVICAFVVFLGRSLSPAGRGAVPSGLAAVLAGLVLALGALLLLTLLALDAGGGHRRAAVAAGAVAVPAGHAHVEAVLAT